MTDGSSSGRAAHYFSDQPEVGSDRRRISLTLPDGTLALTTDRGVFSADQVDVGTKFLLLDGPSPTPGDQHLVDLGAGYGPIALTLGRRNPDATVWAVEVNGRARDLCRENAETAGLANVRVVAPEEVPADLAIDRIWSNPPIRIGKTELHSLLTRWLRRLQTEGSAHLVVQRHLGADSLHRWLEDNGWRVERRGSRKAFRLLDVRPVASCDRPSPEGTP